MAKFIFTNHSRKIFLSLSKKNQKRIIDKLNYLKNFKNIFPLLKKLEGYEQVTHRLRIGSFRLILQLLKKEKEILFKIVDLGHRKDIYK